MIFPNIRRLLKVVKVSITRRGLWGTVKFAFFTLRLGGVSRLFASDPNDRNTYKLWLEKNQPTDDDLRNFESSVNQLEIRPLISVVMPVYNTPVQYLSEAIESVVSQAYPHWELCIADDCSTNPKVRHVLDRYAATDSRIKIKYREENGHICKASNSAIQLATGEYLAFLDHDDVLTPDALYEVALLVENHPDADLIYTDEDKLDEAGKRVNPYFKPGWSPDCLLSTMYTCHLSVYRRNIVNQIGGIRVGLEGSQDHDLALRFAERTEAIYHIPKVLYSWRIHPQSAAHDANTKNYASEAGRRAIGDAIKRRGEPGKVSELPGYPGRYRIRYSRVKNPLVSIVIPTRDLPEILDRCLTSVFQRSTYSNFEVLQIDNKSEEAETKDLFAKWEGLEPSRYRVFENHMPFNFSKLNNQAATFAMGDYLLFLNNDTEVISPDWIEALLTQVQRESIGAAGPKLLYANNTIQHAGLMLGYGASQIAGHLCSGLAAEASGYFGYLRMTSNVSAVTGACLMCKREAFEEVEGFDERLSVAYNDVDLCLKFRQKGLNNIFIPHAQLYHHESKTRGYDDKGLKQKRLGEEASIMKRKWGQTLLNDPYYNPNFSKEYCDFRVKLD